MSWGPTIGIAFATAIAGAASAFYLGYLCEDWYRITSHELGRGIFALSLVIPGLLIGFAVGLAIARLIPSFWAAQCLALAAVVVLSAIIGFFARMYGEVAPELDGDRLILQVELKCPRDWKPDNKSKSENGSSCWLHPMGPGLRRGPSFYGSAGKPVESDGQTVVSCAVTLGSSRLNRYVQVILGNSLDLQFRLPLPANPGAEYQHWTQWTSDGFSQPTGKPPVTGYAYRCRIRRVSELEKENADAKNAQEQARQNALAAIPADAPLERWLPFFEDWDRARHVPANDALEAKPLELGPLLQSTDPNVVRLAVFAAAQLQQIPAPLIDPLTAAGHLTIDFIRQARAGAMPDDPDLVAETKAQDYFTKWTLAMNNVHASSAQFRPMLEQAEREAASSTAGPIQEIARAAREQLEKLAGGQFPAPHV